MCEAYYEGLGWAPLEATSPNGVFSIGNTPFLTKHYDENAILRIDASVVDGTLDSIPEGLPSNELSPKEQLRWSYKDIEAAMTAQNWRQRALHRHCDSFIELLLQQRIEEA